MALTLLRADAGVSLTTPLPDDIARVWLPPYKSTREFLTLMPTLARLLWVEVGRVDLVLACTPCLHAVLALVLGRIRGKPCIVLSTGTWAESGGRGRIGRIAEVASHAAATVSASLATKVLACGAPLLDEVAKPLRSKATIVNPTTLVAEDFADRAESDAGDVDLLCVARLVSRKRIDVAIRTVKVLVERGIAASLTIAGDGPERESLEVLARHLGLEERVTFVGFVDDPARLRRLYRSSFAMLMPTAHKEGNARVIQEAMAARTPVVSTPAGGLRDLLVDGADSLVVETPDAERFADAVQRLLEDEPLRGRLVDTAQDKVRSQTNDAWVDSFHETITRLALQS